MTSTPAPIGATGVPDTAEDSELTTKEDAEKGEESGMDTDEDFCQCLDETEWSIPDLVYTLSTWAIMATIVVIGSLAAIAILIEEMTWKLNQHGGLIQTEKDTREAWQSVGDSMDTLNASVHTVNDIELEQLSYLQTAIEELQKDLKANAGIPSFDVTITKNLEVPHSVLTKVVFDEVRLNVGGGFNKDPSTFTCKVGGVYMFELRIQCKGCYYDIRVDVRKNNPVKDGEHMEPMDQKGVVMTVQTLNEGLHKTSADFNKALSFTGSQLIPLKEEDVLGVSAFMILKIESGKVILPANDDDPADYGVSADAQRERNLQIHELSQVEWSGKLLYLLGD